VTRKEIITKMNHTLSLRCFFVLTLFVNLNFNASASENDVHRKICMDDNWKFHFGHAADPSQDFGYRLANIYSKTGGKSATAISTTFDDSTWRILNLPHDWVVELPFQESDNRDVMSHGYKPVGGSFPETSIGWYRKHFEVNRADSMKRFVITFDGVFRDSKYWINGHYLGGNESGYIGTSFDITDFLDFYGENILVVRVDATQYEGWFYEGAGIYRHVWLNIHDKIHIVPEGLFIYTETANGRTRILIENEIKNLNSDTRTVYVQCKLSDREGNIVCTGEEIPLYVEGFGEVILRDELLFDDARMWSLDDPYLYRLISEIREGDEITDRIITPIGIRNIRIDPDKGLFLNDKHIKVMGVNCHQDHAGVGSALPDYLNYYRIRLLKELGANAYRTSHNPPTPELLEACDSLGMLVIDETRLLNSGTEYMDQFRRMIRRDLNHPCIFMWSIGNEEGWVQRTETGKRIATTMLNELKKLDPTRTATYAADLPNYFEGINEVIPVRGFNYRIQAIEDYHNDHPWQPTVGTEMGSTVTTRGIYEKDTVRCYLPDQDLNAPWWASLAEYWWSIAAEREWFMGGFIWTGFDYRGEPTPFHWPNINSHFGIMDMCGFPKNLYYYYQSWWSDKDVLHISPHWNWNGMEGDTIDVWVNTNAEQVELFLNDRSLGKKIIKPNSHLEWKVVYEPGTVKAVAQKDGRTLTASRSTTGEPYSIVLVPDREEVMADGKDASIVNVHVVDEQGREVPDATNLIIFEVDGPGRIIGVGNGDPSSHEPDKILSGNYQRHLFSGRCQMILQSADRKGEIVIKGSSEGLKSHSVTIIAE
jgi:beta-galactosidase